jgi:hypothetical protein
MKQHQFGGTLEGRLLKDRAFFFGSYQRTRQVCGLIPYIQRLFFKSQLKQRRNPKSGDVFPRLRPDKVAS